MSKIIVTHNSPDLDAVTSAWLIKRFMPGWEDAEIVTVPAGTRLNTDHASQDVIEHLDGREIIHVDTGMGPLDHHQFQDENTCAAKLTFEYVKDKSEELKGNKHKTDALSRLVEYVVDDDHFQEVYYPNPSADVYEFSLVSMVAGIKDQYPKDDQTCIRFSLDLLDVVIHKLEDRMWAEEEIREKGIQFNTRWGKGLAIETINDEILKLGQLMGYVVTVRKDPKNGAVRIKTRPARRERVIGDKLQLTEEDLLHVKGQMSNVDIDLTSVYERLKKMDPAATWFFHVSKRMLLNGSSKNPNMRGSKLTLAEVVEVLQNQ